MEDLKSLTIYPEGVIERKLTPMTVNFPYEIVKIHEILSQNQAYGKSTLNILNNGILVTREEGSNVFHKGIYLSDLLRHDSTRKKFKEKYIHKLKYFYRQNFYKILSKKKYDCSVGTLCIGNTSYFHWLFEILPSIHLIEKSKVNLDLLHTPYSLDYQRETLDIMGYKHDRIIPAEKFSVIQAKTLLVPYNEYDGYPWTKDWVLDFIRDRLLIKDSKEYPRRIYINRKNVWKRRISNEKELVNLLLKYDFISFELENLSFLEQVNLFNRAEIIVAPHGAGLSNIVFCEKGVKIVEIIGTSRVAPFFVNIAQRMELKYYYLASKGFSSKEFIDKLNESNIPSDDQYLEVDLEKMKKILEILDADK